MESFALKVLGTSGVSNIKHTRCEVLLDATLKCCLASLDPSEPRPTVCLPRRGLITFRLSHTESGSLLFAVSCAAQLLPRTGKAWVPLFACDSAVVSSLEASTAEKLLVLVTPSCLRQKFVHTSSSGVPDSLNGLQTSRSRRSAISLELQTAPKALARTGRARQSVDFASTNNRLSTRNPLDQATEQAAQDVKQSFKELQKVQQEFRQRRQQHESAAAKFVAWLAARGLEKHFSAVSKTTFAYGENLRVVVAVKQGKLYCKAGSKELEVAEFVEQVTADSLRGKKTRSSSNLRHRRVLTAAN